MISLYYISFYYIGIKLKLAFKGLFKDFKIKLYWILYWIVSSTYLIGTILRSYLTINNTVARFIVLIGSISIGVLIYCLLIFILIDLLRLVFKKVKLSNSLKKYLSQIYCNGISVFLIVIILVCFGGWNARQQVITNYSIDINKSAGENKSLNVVMISDVHVGIGIRENEIDKMVNSINNLNPDIVLFCGDIFDESTPTNLKEYSSKAFKNIESKYGLYGITGNHEYYSNFNESIEYLESGGINILQDKTVKIDNSFYIIGRNDEASLSGTGKKIVELKNELSDADKSIPIIFLNHRPVDIDEAESQGVDLQLSGHTHRGQMFPGNLFTNFLFEDDYGYMKKDDFNLVVSSGYGTWGPPIRVGTKGEIVNIKIKFKD